jgi:enoyl-[acyl-carrier protein] reductase I
MLVHGVAFANKEDLEGSFVATSREGFRTALEVSAYSLVNVTNRVLPLLEKRGGSIVSLSYLAAERAVPSYNVMGSAKAVLEQATRQMAYELGPKNIRVNAVSAGPVSTLAARGIKGFVGMHKDHAERAALKRNITQEEVGKAALFLLSDLSSGVTGEVLYVDAGYRIMGV